MAISPVSEHHLSTEEAAWTQVSRPASPYTEDNVELAAGCSRPSSISPAEPPAVIQGRGADDRDMVQHGLNGNIDANAPRLDRKRKIKSPSSISPPPLKRQSSSFSKKTDRPGSLSKMHKKRMETFHGTPNHCQPDSEPAITARSLSFPVPTEIRHLDTSKKSIGNKIQPSRQLHDSTVLGRATSARDDDDVSILSNMTSSDTMTGSSLRCVQCRRSTAKSYDPLIKCLTCKRRFHDSCRKPAAHSEVDRHSWRCYVCVQKGRQPRPLASAPRNAVKLRHELPFTNHKENPSTSSELGRAANTRLPYISRVRGRGFGDDVISLLQAFEDVELDKLVDDSASLKPPDGSGQTSTASIPTNSAEIPNTPSQRSSQIATDRASSSTLPRNTRQTFQTSFGQSNALENSSVLEPSQPRAGFRATILCTSCGHRRILPTRGEYGSMCHRCKTAKAGNVQKVSIPEILSSKTAEESPQSSPAAISRPESALSDTEKATSWFHEHPASARKLNSKKVSRSKLTIISRDSTEPATSDTDHRTLLDDTLEGSDMEVSSAMTSVEGGFPMQQLNVPKAKIPGHCVSSNDPNGPELTDLPSDLDTSLEPPRLIIDSTEQEGKHGTDDVEHNPEVRPTPRRSSNYNRANYSYRELIALSLLMADKPCLNALEIQSWIAMTFPDTHKVGEGPWENSIKAVLSQHSDFRRQSVAGTRFSNWSFDTTATRASYEELIPNLANTTPSPQQDSGPPGTAQRALTGQRKSTRLHTPSTSKSRRSTRLQLVESTDPEPKKHTFNIGSDIRHSEQALEALNDVRLMLQQGSSSCNDTSSAVARLDEVVKFWTSTQRQQKQTPSPQSLKATDQSLSSLPLKKTSQPFELQEGIVLEPKFEDAFPDYVEPLTDADKSKKIGEIRKRPTRKAMFGKSLSYKRFSQKNVFDEKNHGTSSELEEERDEGDHNHSRGLAATLRGLMLQAQEKNREEGTLRQNDLQFPEDPILMLHEGQLAFRDGTRINGRLPRPRAIYKFGRRF